MSTRVNPKSRLVDVRIPHEVLTALTEGARLTGLKPQVLLKRYLRNGLIRDGFLAGEVEPTVTKPQPVAVEPVTAPVAALTEGLERLFGVPAVLERKD